MVWKRLFGTNDTPDPQPEAPASPQEASRPTATPTRDIPPHLAQVIERRNPEQAPERTPEQRKLDALRRQRMAILFDIEQGETAAEPDNPWTRRMALLTDAMTTVQQDIATARTVEPGPYAPLPATPITIDQIEIDDVATVTFHIGPETFVYAEDPDWADRSRVVTRGELLRRSGSPAGLVPDTTPAELVEPLETHLGDSLFVLAADLRDRVLDNDPLPADPTLADLANPCPTCGGWTGWRGTCQACAARQATLAALRREEHRLLDERTAEANERHRLVEGLPLARRRLRDVDANLARLGDTLE